jgi:lysophospholipase L1-like esterase
MTRWKRLTFTLVMCAVPLVILGALEASLRIAGYGGDLDLVVRKRAGGKDWYTLNRSVARRYFAQSGTVIPEPSEDVFAVRKSAKTRRIFCLGESTMAGFPYEFNATAPSMLKDRLRTLLPGYDIEVINAGLSAVGSHVVADFIPELAHFEPDLFIIYVGHNEFYGAYGVGSNVAVRGPAWLTPLTISLLRFKTFLLMRDLYARVAGRQVQREAARSATLMEQVVGKESIGYRNGLYREAEEIYRDNLRRIIHAARSRGIPVLFSSLVSNIRHQPPFEPMFSAGADSLRRRAWEEAVAAGDADTIRGAWVEAAAKYRKAIEIDSAHAGGYFRLGETLCRIGEFRAAKSAFTMAKDLDGLRFRASEDFQRDLSEICREEGVALARTDSAFEAASPAGIIGGELMLEHLHPNLTGYALMAKEITRAISAHHLLVPAEEWQWSRDGSDGAYAAISMTSEFDVKAAAIKIGRLTRQWPFATRSTPYTFEPRSRVDEIVLRYAQGKIIWSHARYELAEHYAVSNQFGLARRECLAVAKAAPYSYEPLLRVADYYRKEEHNDSAQAMYRQSIAVEENPYAHLKIAVILLEANRPGDAAREIEAGFEAEKSNGYRLPVPAAANARYLLGIAYAQSGKPALARENLERCVAIDPSNADARDLLQQLQQGRTP